jgi:hypothetical protein
MKIINTDLGEAEVVQIPSAKASKIHVCAICTYDTEFYEAHLKVIPFQHRAAKRYVHTKCLESAEELGVEIRLNTVCQL